LRVYHRRVAEIPFEWHHHPEYELTLTLNSKGWRFIGDHVGQYHAPDLVLVPPDMPHTWASTANLHRGEPHTAIVVWFSGPWLTRFMDLCPEYSGIRTLLRRSFTGLAFETSAAERIAKRARGLLAKQARARLHRTLELLLELADVPADALSTNIGNVRPTAESEPAQLTRVLDYLHKRFHETIRIATLCEVGNLSARSLHRLFVKHVGESVSDYLCRLRIGRACMRLVESDATVSMIAYEVGLANLANFNRHFRRVRHMTPTAYRESVKQLGRGLDDPGGNDPQNLSERPKSLDGRRRHQRFKAPITGGLTETSL
ncbi:MAG: AraC family transcriptional regulator, partial [Candidatus Acidiferrales bacterium]